MNNNITNPLFYRFGGKCQPGDIAPYVLVPGSKQRVKNLVDLWDSSRQVAEFREYLIYTGVYKGVPVSACSTGIGGASVALAASELYELGGRTFIRVGVTGPLQSFVNVGDVIIASAAIRNDRISDYYLYSDIPALASLDVVLALVAACQRRNVTFHVGVGATAGTFYCGEGKPGFNEYKQSFMNDIAKDFERSGVLDWDTETATLFTTAFVLGARAGRINGVLDNNSTGEYDPNAEERAVHAAVEAIRILANWDKQRSGDDLETLADILPSISKVSVLS
jgi:uridine phosphorylase